MSAASAASARVSVELVGSIGKSVGSFVERVCKSVGSFVECVGSVGKSVGSFVKSKNVFDLELNVFEETFMAF